jgi:hypothetical protein
VFGDHSGSRREIAMTDIVPSVPYRYFPIGVRAFVRTVWPALAFSLGACAEPPCGTTELSQDRIIQIVDNYIEEHFGKRQPYDREIRIHRSNCNYVYFESDVPPRPGGHLEVIVDPNGEVIEFNPGY